MNFNPLSKLRDITHWLNIFMEQRLIQFNMIESSSFADEDEETKIIHETFSKLKTNDFKLYQKLITLITYDAIKILHNEVMKQVDNDEEIEILERLLEIDTFEQLDNIFLPEDDVFDFDEQIEDILDIRSSLIDYSIEFIEGNELTQFAFFDNLRQSNILNNNILYKDCYNVENTYYIFNNFQLTYEWLLDYYCNNINSQNLDYSLSVSTKVTETILSSVSLNTKEIVDQIIDNYKNLLEYLYSLNELTEKETMHLEMLNKKRTEIYKFINTQKNMVQFINTVFKYENFGLAGENNISIPKDILDEHIKSKKNTGGMIYGRSNDN